MSRRLVTSWALAVAVLLALGGCGGGGGGAEEGLSAEQKAQIEQDSAAIGAQVQGVEAGNDAALQAALAFAEAQPSVARAAVEEGSLWVQYRGAGKEVWPSAEAPDSAPPDIAELQAMATALASQTTRTSAALGTRKAVLINALAEEGDRQERLPFFNEMEAMLEAAGFEPVLRLDGPNVTPQELRGLSEYSLIVYSGHGGGVMGGLAFPYAVQTGKIWNGLLDAECPVGDWMTDRLVKMTISDWKDRDGSVHSRSFYAITGNFWASAYEEQHFDSALFMNLACSGARYASYRQGLSSVGVMAYTGWTRPQGKAVYTAWRMLGIMLGGSTLQEAYNALPDWYKSQDASTLWVGPESGLDTTLSATQASRPFVCIDAPFDGETISGREVTVRGQITPPSAFTRATICANGSSSALSVDSAGNYSQAVGLRAGDNTIRVSALGNGEWSEHVSVTGEFSSDILYTALAWNTNHNDVDLHLVPIDGANGGRDECYFGNMNPSWGASLDVDDVDGFGPEHITATALPQGTYRLFVHYWASHGQTTAPTVNVAVSVFGAPTRMFTLQRLASVGDIWNICDIAFPSGTISALDQYETADMARVHAANWPTKPEAR